jgi:hypothetical protein
MIVAREIETEMDIAVENAGAHGRLVIGIQDLLGVKWK